jgi:Peptidase A4 family
MPARRRTAGAVVVAVVAASCWIPGTSRAGAAPRAATDRPPLVTATPPGPGPSLRRDEASVNWAGYVATGHFASVAGAWTQPAVTCPAKNGLAAFWVGLDGSSRSDPTVEQIGTDSDCRGGRQSSFAWFELYPSPMVALNRAVYPVRPGDTLSAAVYVYGSGYLLRLVDAGRWAFSTVQFPSARTRNASAEWIAEAPSSCTLASCRIVRLADFQVVGFTGSEADGRPVSSLAYSRITMTAKGGNRVKAATSGLSASGSSFWVVWRRP